MGQSQSKPVQSIFSTASKENRPPIKVPHKKIHSPKMKVNFNYIKPLNHEIEEMPDDQFTQFGENQSSNFKSSSDVEPTQSYYSLSHAQEIKVRWNSFAKMKQRNYLTDYEVIKKIGRGGFGIVNKVKSIHTQVIRAAKIIKKKELKEEQHKRLLQQLTIMRSLDHPNIVKIYEIYDYKDQYTLILEHMSGGQLYKKIKGKKISQKLARIYMKQIIITLIYLHSQGIVHRDLKPQNMLFQNEGSHILKIIDFGIATTLELDSHLTDRIGTPYFIAPEVIYKKYNEKCDIWSAGVIFYMMLTGLMPFKADNEVNLLQNILREEPKFTGSTFQKYSPECLEVLKLMLQKKPQKRPSAFEILNHKWFSMQQEGTQIIDQKKGQQILTNIRKFNFSNKLQAVVHTFIASQLLSSQQKSILVNIFRELDLNNDGVISSEELKQALQKKRRISMQRVEFLVKIIDTNCSGQIEYTQFLVAGLSSDQFMKREHFEKAFAYFDIDHSGTITYEEVVEFLQNYQQSEQEIKKMFDEVDKNGDGQIDKEEFITLFLSRTSQLKLLYSNNDSKSIKQLQPTIKQKRKLLLEQLNLNDLQLDDIRYCD